MSVGWRWSFLTPILAISLSFTNGCASGYLRYKTMGDWKYASAELPRQSNSRSAKAFRVAQGVVIDTSVLVVDTCITPIVALVPVVYGPPALLLGFDDNPFLILSPLFYPVYLYWFGGYGGEDGRDARDLFGSESTRWHREKGWDKSAWGWNNTEETERQAIGGGW